MVLAACAKDLKFYSWPEISLLGVYDDQEEGTYMKTFSWDSDGNYVICVKSNGQSSIFKAPTKIEENLQPIIQLNCPGTSTATFSSLCNNRIALGTTNGDIKIYDVKEKEIIAEYRKLPGAIQRIEFLKNDLSLVAGFNNGQIIVYNKLKEPCSSFNVPGSFSLTAMVPHHLQQNLLAASSKEGVVCAWDIEKSCNKMIAKDHTGVVTDIAFYGDTLTSVSVDHNICVYDLRDGKQVSNYDLNSPLSGVSYHQNTYEVAISTCDGQLRSYDTRHMSSPLHIVVAFNCWIKKIDFPQGSPLPASLQRCRNGLLTVGGSTASPASGDFAMEKENRNNELVSANDLMRSVSEVFYRTSDQTISKEEVTDLVRDIEKHLRARKTACEEKMLQRFYMLRIEGSKQFITLEDQVNESWQNFIGYLKYTGSNNKKIKPKTVESKRR